MTLPFSKSFREIRLECKWVPYSAYSLQTVIGSLTSHSIYMNKDRETGRTGFVYSKKTRKTNCLQMTTGSTSRQLFKDPYR